MSDVNTYVLVHTYVPRWMLEGAFDRRYVMESIPPAFRKLIRGTGVFSGIAPEGDSI